MALNTVAIIAVYFFVFFIHLGWAMARLARPTAVVVISMARTTVGPMMIGGEGVIEISVLPIARILVAVCARCREVIGRRRMAGRTIGTTNCAVIKVSVFPITCVLVTGTTRATVVVGRGAPRMAG